MIATPVLLSWVLGITSVYGLYLAGKHDWRGWAFTVACEPVWIVYAILTHGWGFLIGAIGYMVVGIWNLWKWRHGR